MVTSRSGQMSRGGRLRLRDGAGVEQERGERQQRERLRHRGTRFRAGFADFADFAGFSGFSVFADFPRLCRRQAPPTLCDEDAQVAHGDGVETHEHRWIAVVVRLGEEAHGVGGEDRLLLP
ncbi:MAG: hypothetical protein IPK33_24075 [Gemmatimonadetes bacterium]|nr:hypothetical protein [Gemmatimonadota bacterium]